MLNLKPSLYVPCGVLFIALGLHAAQRVVTSQYDNARTGANLSETTNQAGLSGLGCGPAHRVFQCPGQ
jgi:hypothetical protein